MINYVQLVTGQKMVKTWRKHRRGVTPLPAVIAATAMVGGCLKMSASVRGIDLGSQPHQRKLADAKKWPEKR